MPEREQQTLLRAALAREAEAQQLLLDGELELASEAFREVSALYRSSWEAAHATAYGRLVGMLKASLLGGAGEPQARYVLAELGRAPASEISAYAVALAALTTAEDSVALGAAQTMGAEGAFGRTAEAITALAEADADGYRQALELIVADFAAREQHVTGVAIADTAAVLEVLAERRGLGAGLSSPLLPPPPPANG